MPIDPIRKQPSEVLNWGIDLSADLGVGDTLTLTSVKAVNRATGVDSTSTVIATIPAPEMIGQIVAFTVKDGTDGDVHHLTFRFLTSSGEELEADIDLIIVEE